VGGGSRHLGGLESGGCRGRGGCILRPKGCTRYARQFPKVCNVGRPS
jgi:hypothetical protein